MVMRTDFHSRADECLYRRPSTRTPNAYDDAAYFYTAISHLLKHTFQPAHSAADHWAQ